MPSEDLKDLLVTNKNKSKIIIDTSGSIYIENYGSLRKYTAEEISFKNALQEIEIYGEGLSIESIARECSWVRGKINTLRLKELFS